MTVRHLALPSFDQELLAVDVWGESLTEQPLIISHGMGGDSNALVWLVKEIFAKKKSSQPLSIITYDLRGHGKSSRIFPRAKNIETVLAQDLQAICQHLRAKKPIFLGHSFGGIIVQEYLNQNLQPQPQRIFLVSSALSFPGLSAVRKVMFRWLTKYSPLQVALPKRSPEDHLRYKNSFDYHPGRIWADVTAMGGLEFILMYLSLLGWRNPRPNTLRQIACEYIWGAQDLVLWPSAQLQTIQKHPFLHSHTIKSNHNPVVNNPQDLAKIVSKTLTIK